MKEIASNERKNQLNIPKTEVIFLLAFFVYMSANTLDLTAAAFGQGNDRLSLINIFTKMARYVAYILLAFKVICSDIYNRKRIKLFLDVSCVVALSFWGSFNKTIIFYLLIFIAACNVDENHIIKISCAVQSVVLCVCVIGSRIGVIKDYVRQDGGRIRHFLGFSWTTTGAILFVFILLQYIYLKKGKLSIWEDIIALGISLYLYKMTNSRFAFLISIVTIIIFAIYRLNVNNGRFIQKLKGVFIASPVVVAIFAILLHAFYNPQNTIYFQLNKLLSGRLALGQNAMSEYGISLFGKDIEWIGFNMEETLRGTYNYVDCSYVKILLDHGILFLGIVLLAYAYMLKKSIQKKQYYYTWILMIIMIFCITEPRLFDITFNPFIVLTLAGQKSIVDKDVKRGMGDAREYAKK